MFLKNHELKKVVLAHWLVAPHLAILSSYCLLGKQPIQTWNVYIAGTSRVWSISLGVFFPSPQGKEALLLFPSHRAKKSPFVNAQIDSFLSFNAFIIKWLGQGEKGTVVTGSSQQVLLRGSSPNPMILSSEKWDIAEPVILSFGH